MANWVYPNTDRLIELKQTSDAPRECLQFKGEKGSIMRLHNLVKIIGVVISMGFLLSNCAVMPSRPGPPFGRKEEYLIRHSWRMNSIEIWAIENGIIYKGMDSEDVKASWGYPYGFCKSCTNYHASKWYYYACYEVKWWTEDGKEYQGWVLKKNALDVVPKRGVVREVEIGQIVGKKYSLVTFKNGKLILVSDKKGFF